jgi:flagellar hook-basal body complex protein FliE
MTPPIAAISSIVPVAQLSATSAPAAVTGGSGASFASALAHGLDQMAGSQATAGNLATQAATGTLTDPAQYTAAATEASLMTQLATTVTSKAVTAFNTVMGMQA